MPTKISRIYSKTHHIETTIAGNKATAAFSGTVTTLQDFILKISLPDPYAPRATLEISENLRKE
jgi:hypothetical protein